MVLEVLLSLPDIQSTCKASKQKWQCVLMVLQLAMEVWNSSGKLNGRYWNKFEAKRTRESGDGGGSLGLALFCRKTVFLCIRRFKGSRARASDL